MTGLPIPEGVAAVRYSRRPPVWTVVPRIEGDEAAPFSPKRWRIYRQRAVWNGQEWETVSLHALRGVWTDEAAVRARVKQLNEGKR